MNAENPFAAFRKTVIQFGTDRSVEYLVERFGSLLDSFLIEHPEDRVQIIDASPGCVVERTSSGRMRLHWMEVPGQDRCWIHYRKRDFLVPVRIEEQELYLYEENHPIQARPRHGLWLGSATGPMSAVRARSTAEFQASDGSSKVFKPRELQEHVFHESGVLKVRWVLESRVLKPKVVP